jgi:plastocyanin
MKRGMLLCVIVGAATVVLGMPGAALAGGGCHSPVTSNDASGDDKATVRMIDACFKASLTTVDPGTTVTFVNEDWTTHNVGGNEWGNFEDMREGDAFTATFAESGIYPFACSYHPGMTGAIVVGDGKGAGSGEAITVRPFEATSPKVVRPAVAEDGGLPIGALVGVALAGLALGAAAMLVIGRRGRTSAAA